MQVRIKIIREELENRTKYGTIKLANLDGSPVDTLILQNELYLLTYKLSKKE